MFDECVLCAVQWLVRLVLLFCLFLQTTARQRVPLSGRQASQGASECHAHVRGIGAGNTCGKKVADLAAVVAATAAASAAARRPNTGGRPFSLARRHHAQRKKIYI